MKILIFTGRAESPDKEPLLCREETEVSEKEVRFGSYPLSLLKTAISEDGVTADGVKYEWEKLPITINKVGKHVTVYRDTVEENITLTVELKNIDTEGRK